MHALGRTFILAGLIFVLVGLFLTVGPNVPFLGRLPGDIRIERPGFRLYAPITTCLLLSLLVSGVLWLVSKLR